MNTTPTFRVNAALPAYTRVKLSGGKLVVAVAADVNAVGLTSRETFAADDPVSVITSHPVRKRIANDAITQYAEYEEAADGEIAPQSSGPAKGIVLEASTADGDIVRTLEYEAPAVQLAAIADLDQDISASYTEAEVQAISDKVDALLTELRAKNLMAAS